MDENLILKWLVFLQIDVFALYFFLNRLINVPGA